MARTLDAFPDEVESVKRARYPWNTWLDGSVWELRKGTPEQVKGGEADYSVTTKSFTSAVKQAVASRKGDVRIATMDKSGKVIVQFLPADGDDGGDDTAE